MRKTLVCILLLSLSGCLVPGCSSASMTKYEDGVITERVQYNRWGNQEIGSMLRETDGSFLLEGQRSEHAALAEVINKLVDRIP